MLVLQFVKFFFLSLFACGLFLACQPDMSQVAEFSRDTQADVEEMTEMEFFYSEGGKVISQMKAPVMKRYTQPHEILEFPRGFELTIFDSLQQPKTLVSALYGKQDMKEQIIEARHNVIVKDVIEQKSLYTEQLFMNNHTQRVYSDKFVKIVTPDKIIFGDGFESDKDFKDYTIVKPKGEIVLKRNNQQ